MRRNRIILTLAGIAAAFMLVLLVYVPAMAAQKYMESAISKLEDAKSDLDKASRDKGGHRAKAVKLIDEAISEVRKGIEYDRTHVSPEEGERKHSNKVDLDDLRDMKARNLDSQMKDRGFRNKGGYKQDQSAFTTWWNSSTKQCVSIETKDGRVHKIEEIYEGNCK